MSRLELRHVSVALGQKRVLDDVSLAAADGEFLVLVGPSGSGKSTLLRVIAGLAPADAGDVLLDGERVNDLEPRERDVAMVFQNYALYPHKTVRGNLSFPLEVARVARADIARRVADTAAALGLGELLERKPGTLSGGQMQRVALGRAIVRDPRLFLFDEPLSNLDARLRGELRAEIARLHRRLGQTTVYVTHDQAEAMTLGSRIAVLAEGRLEQVGPPLEVYDRPRTAFVAAFIGSPPMNLLRGVVRDGGFELGPFRLPVPGVEKGNVLLGIRPQEIRLRPVEDVPAESAGVPVEAGVARVEELGAQALIECEVDGRAVRVVRTGRAGCRVGERIALELPRGALHWFDTESGRRL